MVFHWTSHLSYMVQKDRTDSRIWGSTGGMGGIPLDVPPVLHGTVGYGWYMGFPWSFPPVLHGRVAVVYCGPRWDSGFPWTVPPVPWYSGIPTYVLWILMADLDIPARCVHIRTTADHLLWHTLTQAHPHPGTPSPRHTLTQAHPHPATHSPRLTLTQPHTYPHPATHSPSPSHTLTEAHPPFSRTSIPDFVSYM